MSTPDKSPTSVQTALSRNIQDVRFAEGQEERFYNDRRGLLKIRDDIYESKRKTRATKARIQSLEEQKAHLQVKLEAPLAQRKKQISPEQSESDSDAEDTGFASSDDLLFSGFSSTDPDSDVSEEKPKRNGRERKGGGHSRKTGKGGAVSKGQPDAGVVEIDGLSEEIHALQKVLHDQQAEVSRLQSLFDTRAESVRAQHANSKKGAVGSICTTPHALQYLDDILAYRGYYRTLPQSKIEFISKRMMNTFGAVSTLLYMQRQENHSNASI